MVRMAVKATVLMSTALRPFISTRNQFSRLFSAEERNKGSVTTATGRRCLVLPQQVEGTHLGGGLCRGQLVGENRKWLVAVSPRVVVVTVLFGVVPLSLLRSVLCSWQE